MRRWGGGKLSLLGTLAAEPATIPPEGAPLLFQRGEVYKDVLLVDRQHPHDLFVQLAARWDRPVTSRSTIQLYLSPWGEPAVGPTAWALLALQDYPDRAENQRSLDWLEQSYPSICGPGSLVLANLSLEICGRPAPPLQPALERLYLSHQFLQNVSVMAWAALALSPARATLQWTARREPESGKPESGEVVA